MRPWLPYIYGLGGIVCMFVAIFVTDPARRTSAILFGLIMFMHADLLAMRNEISGINRPRRRP